MTHEESKIQQACVRWFRLQYPGHILFAIPNGGRRGKLEAAIMKGEGVLAGVADLFLAMPSGKYHGLFVEMKTARGRQTPAQKDFEKRAIFGGYEYVICRSVEEFIEAINNYLNKQMKKYALINSYFKRRYGNMPDTILEIAKYYKEHGELPFSYEGSNWVYDAFCERQKRKVVYKSQFLTPDATVDRMLHFAGKYFAENDVVEPCCGTGQITKGLISRKYYVTAFDVDWEMTGVCQLLNNSPYLTTVFQADFRDVFFEANQIIANPPYEVAELTDFLEWILSVQDSGRGLSVLLLPKGFIDKNKPKRTFDVLQKFGVLEKEDMREEFERTKTRAEIVVLKKI